jgi:peroxiredoxin
LQLQSGGAGNTIELLFTNSTARKVLGEPLMNLLQAQQLLSGKHRTPPIRISGLVITCVMLLWAFITPALFGQQNVHAALIASTARKPAPTFHLVGETGRTMQVSDYQGKVVLLNFWATDCGGCRLEIPSFIELQQTYKDKGFTAIGVAMDISYEQLKNADEAWKRVTPFIVNHKLNYPILMGDDSVLNAYAINAYPATYLIDKSGKIAATYVGVVNKDNVEANIHTLLSER